MTGGVVAPVLPDGCMDVIWCDGRLLVAGPDTGPQVPDGAVSGYVGVRFAPGQGPGIVGVPANELLNVRVDLAEVWPRADVRRLAERIADAPDRAAVLEDAVLVREDTTDSVMRTVAMALAAGHGVADVADSAGFGVRQLHRKSLGAFGYGPKTLARILRLQRALRCVAVGMSYAAAAQTVGYADQAHLARDVRDLAGTTLSAYAAMVEKEALPQCVNGSG
jgi:AraC-like DNA-binding protein